MFSFGLLFWKSLIFLISILLLLSLLFNLSAASHLLIKVIKTALICSWDIWVVTSHIVSIWKVSLSTRMIFQCHWKRLIITLASKMTFLSTNIGSFLSFLHSLLQEVEVSSLNFSLFTLQSLTMPSSSHLQAQSHLLTLPNPANHSL